ncbi:MAG: 50S ribosomal protein L22 [Oscillospiraceae bacterium]|jgi:large subunit ribosomal protein L22|nr:50S ribosomal protein L22 [Oscillospiraceae bacterium]
MKNSNNLKSFSSEVVAHLKYARISPRKVGIVLDLIRNKPVRLALAILQNTSKSASEYLEKLLKSAIANAVNNNDMEVSNLYISECFVCPGPTARRMLPVSKGRGHRILKRSSHVTIAVKDRRS